MARTARWLLHVCTVLLGLAAASAALAVSNVEVTPTGPRASETTIRLFDSGGKPVTSDAGNPNRYSNLPTGSYSAETVVGGKQVGQRTTVRLDDGDNQLRVDSTTGAIEVIRRLARRQQQQQDGFGFGIFGGWKQTPFDGTLSSTALGQSGSTDLKTDAGNLTLEGRYHFRALPQIRARPFIFGGYTEYFGANEEKRYLDFHPTPGMDSGIGIDEKHSWTLGLGARWNLTEQVGLEFMVGGHATRTRVSALSNESCCGGIDNRISRTDYLKGAMLGVGLSYQLGRFASGRPITGIARYTAMHMDDIDVRGMSATFPFDYAARVNGGWNHSVQFGLTF